MTGQETIRVETDARGVARLTLARPERKNALSARMMDELTDFARAAEAGGAALITIHARAREQRHDGPVDTAALRAAKSAVAIPVVANGGVESAEDALWLLRESGCDAVMIGRGAHGRPWLFRDVARALAGREPLPPPSAEERARLMGEHFEGLLELVGAHGVHLFRKHARWYFHSRPEAPEFVERLYRAQTEATVRELIAGWEALARACAG